METTGKCIRCYMHQEYRHEGKPLNEWLLMKARSLKIQGGTGFQALNGFGRHGLVREKHFAGYAEDAAPVVVEFFVTDAQADQLRNLIAGTGKEVFVAEWPAHFKEYPHRPGPEDKI